jgi:hypothetical protein
VSAGAAGTLPLARLLIRQRFVSLRNGLRARRAGRSALLVTGVGLMVSLGYVGLFAQAFSVIAESADLAGQTAALALVAGALALGNLAAKAASSEAVRAGSPENEFLLARPVALPVLVTARAIADALTDPVGALFLLPVLVAAAAVWRLPAAALAVAALTSMLVQVTISALAYAVQLAVVRYVRPARRRLCWMALRLSAALALACLWMLGTWVLRAPAVLAGELGRLAPFIARSPAALVAAPLAALARGEPVEAALASLILAAVALGAVLVSRRVAGRAGLGGWEEAGAAWAEAAPGPTGRRAPSAATKDLLLVARDGPYLLALVAMPILFVGVQIFGAAGWGWSTGSLTRVACLAYSLALYMATIGPLTHMQAERRAFWILRTVPVPLGRLLGAKARAWSVIVGGIAALAFLPLSFAVPGASVAARLGTGALVVGGAAAMSFLAVAMAASGADLSDDQRSAVGPGTIYAFLLVGGLYNLVLGGDGPVRVAGLGLYAYVVLAYWRAGMDRAASCMDPEAVAARPLRLADGAALAVVYACGARGLRGAGALLADPAGAVVWVLGLELVLGAAAGLRLARQPSGRTRGPLFSAAVGVALGSGLGVGARALGAVPPPGGSAAALVLGAAVIAAEELLFRGVVQGTAAGELERLGVGARGAAAGAGFISVALAAVTAIIAGAALGPASLVGPWLVGQLAAAGARAVTGRTSAAWLARSIGMAIAALAS